MNRFLPVLLIFSLLGGCSAKNEKKESPSPAEESATRVTLTDAQIKSAGITTGTPEMRSMQAVLRVNGLVDLPPQNLVTISFPPGGYIRSTTMLPGMKVSRGQVLAVVEDPSFVQMQEDYLTATVKLRFLQKEWERQKGLNATKTTSDKIFEQTTSDYESQRILVRALHEKLLLTGIDPGKLTGGKISSRVSILAPISGYVAAVNVNPGKYVSPTDVLFELINPDDLHLALTIFERDVPSIRPGQKLTAWLVSDTARTYGAQVILVGKMLDSSRSMQVHCHFTGPVPPLTPGMFVDAAIQLSNREMIAVPEEAVVRSGDREWIFVERAQRQFELEPVTTGSTQNGFTGILSAGRDFSGKVIIKTNAYAALMKLKNRGGEE